MHTTQNSGSGGFNLIALAIYQYVPNVSSFHLALAKLYQCPSTYTRHSTMPMTLHNITMHVATMCYCNSWHRNSDQVVDSPQGELPRKH